jgi:hypothetical protein
VRTVEVVVVYDVDCPNCSQIARELPELLRVPVRVLSCRNPGLATAYPGLRAAARSCATPALGAVRRDGSVRWWYGLAGALGVLPVLRPRGAWEAAALLWTALRTPSRARHR